MISRRVSEKMAGGSWIRKMFEEGSRLKELYGNENVFDFSLGNPDLEPPAEVLQALRDLSEHPTAGSHGYMNNAGYLETRSAISADLSARSGIPITADAICMTVGAAGGLNVALKALLDAGDEVIVLAPYFVEYLSYIENHGGVPVIVECNRQTLLPEPQSLAAAVTARTKAVIINSPNNPSGRVYPAELLVQIDEILCDCPQTVYVLSDEPYIDLVYDGKNVPESMAHLTNVLVCFSWSKSLSLAGERIGFVAVSPRCQDYSNLTAAIGYCNRTLGFVNAPALFQRVIERSLQARVDVSRYETRRNRLYEILIECGFSLNRPEGGLYLFMKTPDPDDSAFAKVCARHNVLLVPGRGFGYPGYVRLCFAVSDQTIERSAAAFKKIAGQYPL